ncbi:MAG: hypothetical protein WBF79_08665 [Rhodococcus sp. (in: high G+C Gram-positive bacteria)]
MADHHWSDRAPRVSARPTDDHNLLVRPVDRAQARLDRLLTTLVLIAIPFAVVMGINIFHQQEVAAAEAAASRHTVEAVTTEEAPGVPVTTDQFTAVPPMVLAAATWTADGSTHTGSVPVEASSAEGTSVTITVDEQGHRVYPAATAADVLAAAVISTVALLGLVFLCAVLARAGSARWFDRRRRREWDDALAQLLA